MVSYASGMKKTDTLQIQSNIELVHDRLVGALPFLGQRLATHLVLLGGRPAEFQYNTCLSLCTEGEGPPWTLLQTHLDN